MNVFELVGTIAIDGVDKANEEIDKVSSNAESMSTKVGNGLKSAGTTMTNVGQKMLPFTALITGLGAAAVKFASDTEESTNKVDVCFGKSKTEVEKFASSSLKNFGIAKGTAMDMASTFGDMATSMGLTQPEAAKMSTSMVGLAGDLASFKNIGIDQATTALNGVFTGETESLKGLGIVMTQTNLDAFALANGFGKTTAEMTEAEKVQLRYAYVMDATKNAQGDFARTSDGTANTMRITTESLKELASNMGTVLLPIVAKVLGKVNEWIQKFASMSEETKKAILVIAGIVASLAPVLIVFGKISTGLGSFITMIPKLTSSISGAMSGFSGLSGVIGAITSPIGIVVMAIGALIAIFVTLWNTNESFRNSVLQVWENVKSTISTAVELLKQIFASFVELVNALWNAFGQDIMNVVMTVFNALSPIIETALNLIKNIITTITALINGDWSGAWEGIKAIVSSAWELIKSIVSGAINVIKSVIESVLNIIKTIFSTTWEGIKTIVSTVINAISSAISTVWNGIKSTISSIMDGIRNTFSNVWNGIKNTVSNVIDGVKNTISNGLNGAKNTVSNVLGGIKDKFSSIFEGAKNIVSGAIDKIKGFFNFNWSLPKLKMPHFSISGSFSLSPPSIPHMGVEWYKKAMDEPYMFTDPTLFDYNPVTGTARGAGEAGDEMMYGKNSLMNDIGEVVANQNGGLVQVIKEMFNQQFDIFDKLFDILETYFPEFTKSLVLDTGVLVAETAEQYDDALGIIKKRKERG